MDDVAAPIYGYALANVLANDTLAGAPATLATVALTQVSSTSTNVQLATQNGGVYVTVGATPGAHTLRYRICERASPINCDEASVSVTVVAQPIDAVNDAGTVTRLGGTAVGNVLTNDRFNGAAATTARVDLAVSSSSAGVTLNTTTGAVSVASGTAAGSYALVYRICEIATPSNCDSATVSVTVTAYAIDAVNDSTRPLKTDERGDHPADRPRQRLVRRAAGHDREGEPDAGILGEQQHRAGHGDGRGEADEEDRLGMYALVYRICEIGNASNCDQATVSIDLSGGGPEATRDDSHKSRAGHPGWRRCSSLTYAQYARSSRLASRAPRSGIPREPPQASRGLAAVVEEERRRARRAQGPASTRRHRRVVLPIGQFRATAARLHDTCWKVASVRTSRVRRSRVMLARTLGAADRCAQ